MSMFESFIPQPRTPDVPPPNPHELRGAFTSPDDILGQLNISEPRYLEAFRNLRDDDDNSDIEYLADMQVNLRAFKNALDTNLRVTPQTEEVRDRVNERLYELSELLQSKDEDSDKKDEEQERVLH